MNTMMNIYKMFSNNIIDPSAEKRELININSLVLSELETEIDSKLHITQIETAKKVFKRFFKKVEKRD
jgi:hypothetical protein